MKKIGETISYRELEKLCDYKGHVSFLRLLQNTGVGEKGYYNKWDIEQILNSKSLMVNRRTKLLQLADKLGEETSVNNLTNIVTKVKDNYKTVNGYLNERYGFKNYRIGSKDLNYDIAIYFDDNKLDYYTDRTNGNKLNYYNKEQLHEWFEKYGHLYDITENSNNEELLTRDLIDAITFFKLEIQREVEDQHRRYDLVINGDIYEIKKDELTLSMVAEKLEKDYPIGVTYVAPRINPKCSDYVNKLGVKVKTFEEFFTEFEQQFQLANLSKQYYESKKRQFMSRWVV